MASADFTVLTNSVGTGSIRRGVTNGIARPNGGGSFLYGFNAVVAAAGSVGLHVNNTVGADFAPMLKGGTIRAAMKRGLSADKTGFSPFLFLGATGPAVSDQAYLLGLSDADPHRVVLRKGQLSVGAPDGVVGVSGILSRSTDTYQNDTWLHLRLDMIVNPNNDVILRAYKSDLGANAVTAPVWVEIAEIAFTDDALGVNSGSLPFLSGYGGFGFQSSAINRRSYLDHLECYKQL